VLDTADDGLKIESIDKTVGNPWSITEFLDSNHAGDTESRIRVTGCCVFLMGVPISGKQSSEECYPSSSVAELVALSEVAKEINFIIMSCFPLELKWSGQ